MGYSLYLYESLAQGTVPDDWRQAYVAPVFIPPVYEAYRGYIVFAFSVCVCVCVCKLFFPSKISQELLYLGS